MSSIFTHCAGNNNSNNISISKMVNICGAPLMCCVKHVTLTSFKPNNPSNEVR